MKHIAVPTSLAACAWVCLSAAAEPLRVVTTTSDLAAIASRVAGGHAVVNSICTGNEDPHVIQAKPSFIMLTRRADLWIRVGLELEIGWEPPVLDGSRNTRVRIGTNGHLDAADGVLRLEVPEQRVDRSMGDVHPQGNPHYWLDPWNGRVIAYHIRDRLQRLDAAHAADYDANCTAFVRELDGAVFGGELVAALGGDALWEMELAGTLEDGLRQRGLAGPLGGWLAAMRPHRGAKVISYHRSWVYFVHRFGLDVVAELEPKPGIPPSPGHLAEVIELAKATEAKILLMEPFYDRRGAEFVASKTGVRVVQVANSVGGQVEAADYVAMLDNVVRRVTAALADPNR